jgi:hypothetical protein
MGRIFTSWLVVGLLGVGGAAIPAYAKDRKAAGDREALSAMVAARATSATAPLERSSSGRNGKPIAPLAEQPELRSNPFRMKIGALAVEPSLGGIKGARFSIGF